MGDVPPNAIIIDQCPSIRKTIEIVFPNTRHRWCLWHIMSKFSEKMKRYKEYYSIKEFFNQLVYDSSCIDEFEIGWASMMKNWSLHEHNWLQDLYELREKWAPIYVKRFFWAGMSSTQRSESMNTFFDGYIHSRSSLKQFVDQYEVALMDKIEKETQADFASMNTEIPPYSMYKIEKQFQQICTHGIYVKVRSEFKKMMYCALSDPKIRGNVHMYSINCKVFVNEDSCKRVCYEVTYDSASIDVKCSCLLFELMGILCCHTLCVLGKHDIEVLPSRYVMKKWQKDVKRSHSKLKSSILGSRYWEEVERMRDMEEIFTPAANVACMKQEAYVYMCNELQRLSQKLEEWDRTCNYGCVVNETPAFSTHVDSNMISGDNQETPNIYIDPVIHKRTGRPKATRNKSQAEKKMKNKPRRSKQVNRRDMGSGRLENNKNGQLANQVCTVTVFCN